MSRSPWPLLLHSPTFSTDQKLNRATLVPQVVYTNVSTEFYSPYSGNSPEQFTARVDYAIEQLGTSVSSNAVRQGNTTIAWSGTNYLALPASVNTTGTLLWPLYMLLLPTVSCLHAQLTS